MQPTERAFPPSSFRWTGAATARPRFELDQPDPEMRANLAAFSERCSDDALFRRFHGGGRGGALEREIDRWVAPTPSYLTVVAMLSGEVHGVGNLAVSSAGIAEMAVLVEDEWQRRGVASRLLGRLTRLALERGHETARVDIQPDNHAALTLLGTLATGYSRSFSGGTFRADVGLTTH